MIGRERGIIEGKSERKMIDCYSVARVSNVPVSTRVEDEMLIQDSKDTADGNQ